MDKKPIVTIGLVMKSLQAEFFQAMQRGAEEHTARQERYRLIAVGTDTQTEIERQIVLIDELIAQGVDALVVVPIDSKALVAPVARAVRKGITVVNIDIRLDEALLETEGISLTYVGPDNLSAARTVGNALATRLQPGDEVLLIEGLPVAENAQQRKAGFMEAIAAAGLTLAGSAPANWETKTAEEVFAGLYASHPKTKAVFCCNDAMALGVINVLKREGMPPGQIPVIGFDNDETMQPLLQEGWLLATIDAYGSQMAVQGIEYALQIMDGMPGGGVHSTPFELISPISRCLHSPNLSETP